MRRVLVAPTYVVLGVAALGLLVLNVLAWTGSLPKDAAPEPPPAPQRAPASEPPPPTPPSPQTISRPPPAPPATPAAPTLTISATRGDCWVEVRAESSSGEVLYAGTLESGSTLRFSREKLWVRLGAAANVDVLVNGRPSNVPPGTVELLLPA